MSIRSSPATHPPRPSPPIGHDLYTWARNHLEVSVPVVAAVAGASGVYLSRQFASAFSGGLADAWGIPRSFVPDSTVIAPTMLLLLFVVGAYLAAAAMALLLFIGPVSSWIWGGVHTLIQCVLRRTGALLHRLLPSSALAQVRSWKARFARPAGKAGRRFLGLTVIFLIGFEALFFNYFLTGAARWTGEYWMGPLKRTAWVLDTTPAAPATTRTLIFRDGEQVLERPVRLVDTTRSIYTPCGSVTVRPIPDDGMRWHQETLRIVRYPREESC